MKKIFLIAGAVAILAACLFKVEFVEKTVAQEKKPIAEQKTGSDDSPSTPKIPLKASDRPDVRVYAVEKQVKDFPKTDDYSTPETAVASKIREGAEQYPKQIAEADQAEWTKEKRERNRKMAEEVAKSQWTSEILEVRVFKEKHAMALVHNGYWKYKPFSLWPMKKDGNAWSILPLERLETFEMFTAKFAEAIPRWEREDSGQWISPDGNRSTHLMVLAPQGDFKPRFMVEINYKLAPLWARANNDLSLGHMKTWPEDDKNGQKMLAVGICVNNSEAVREIVEKEIPEFSVLRIETLDEKTFKEYVMKKSRNINGQISWEDATQNTHVIVFTGKDDFKPKTPSEILVPISQAMRKMPVTDKPTAAGWTKSWVEDGRLVGALLTNDPERLEKMISDLTGHRVLRTEKLTDESLKEYQDRVSMGLPPETP